MSSGLTRPTNLSSDWFLHGARCLSSCKLSYTFHVCHVPKPGYVSFRFQLVYPLIRPNRAQYKQKLSAASDSNNYQPVFPEDFYHQSWIIPALCRQLCWFQTLKCHLECFSHIRYSVATLTVRPSHTRSPAPWSCSPANPARLPAPCFLN